MITWYFNVRIFIIIFITSIFCNTFFAQSSDSSSNPEIETQISRKRLQSIINYPFLIGGLSAGVGTSYPLRHQLKDSISHFSLAFSLSGTFILLLSENFGITFEMGGHSFRLSEETDTDYYKLNLIYTYISILPTIRYKNFFFHTGVYFGIIAFSDVDSVAGVDASPKTFKNPDIGISAGGGYMFFDIKSFALLVSLEIKYQINTLKKNNDGGQVLAVYVKTGFLFNLSK